MCVCCVCVLCVCGWVGGWVGVWWGITVGEFLVLQKQSPGGAVKKAVLENFTKFTGKFWYTCTRASFLIKLQISGLCKRSWHRCFPVKFLRTPFHRIPPDDCFCLYQIKSLQRKHKQ